MIPLVRALVEEVNAERQAAARETESRITTAARLAGVVAETHIFQDLYAEMRDSLAAAARLSDVIILTKSPTFFSLERDLIETLLFTSGRPVIVVPSQLAHPIGFGKIVVAWDGSARAARAVGDAMPLLTKAAQVEVVCVTSEAGKSVAGADLANHLARHCRNVTLTELPLKHDDAARAIEEHLASTRADLLVMGAFANSRLLQFVLGGVTSSMLDRAEIPVLFSY
jgi:nucleotide-binding universal stress UspA family protein